MGFFDRRQWRRAPRAENAEPETIPAPGAGAEAGEFERLVSRIRADTAALSQILDARRGQVSREEGVALYRAAGALLAVKRAACSRRSPRSARNEE